ncbi:hypothetical protein H4219_002931, partial [Mycoemilia scoparia]
QYSSPTGTTNTENLDTTRLGPPKEINTIGVLQEADDKAGAKTRTTFIDVLSQHSEFTRLIGLLQRLQLILPLNSLQNVTFFAPTNQAIEEYEKSLMTLVHARGWGWHWPWWPGGGNDKPTSSDGDGGEPEDPLPQTGLEYHGITDIQMWYHIVIDGIYYRHSMIEGLVVQTGSLWRPYTNSTNSTFDTGRSGVYLHVAGTREPFGTDRIVVGNGARVLKSDLNCTSGVIHMVDKVLTLPPSIRHILASKKLYPGLTTNGDPTSEEPIESFSYMLQLLKLSGWDKQVLGASFMEMGFYDIDPPLPKLPSDNDTLTSTFTLFAVSDRGFEQQFSPIERAYLFRGLLNAGNFASIRQMVLNDIHAVAGNHIINGSLSINRLGRQNRNETTFKVKTFNGQELVLKLPRGEGGNLTAATQASVAGVPIVYADSLAYDVKGEIDSSTNADMLPVSVGVVHMVEKPLVPATLEMTPYKYLVGVNATKFIHLFESVGLKNIIDGSEPQREQTLLVPTNRAMDQAFPEESEDDSGDISKGDGTSESQEKDMGVFEGDPIKNAHKHWALYHVIRGQYDIEDMKDGLLLKSELTLSSMRFHPQVVKVSNNDNSHHESHAQRLIFNDNAASVLPDPVKIGNTTIYLISGPMPPPSPVIPSLISDLTQALFVAAMGASGTADEISAQKGVTVLVPGNDQFAALGLLWSYLSLPNDREAREDLSRVIKSHVLKGLVYSNSFDELDTDMISSPTLNGDIMVRLTRLEDGSVRATAVDKDSGKGEREDASLSISIGKDESESKPVVLQDGLLQSGVSHRIEEGVLVPPNVHITTKKLLKGMKADSYLGLLEHFGLLGVLDNTLGKEEVLARASGDPKDQPTAAGYSLLVPNDKAWWDIPAYREFVRRQHEEFIPSLEMQSVNEDADNPWRNKSQAALELYLNQTIRLHVIPIYNHKGSDGKGDPTIPTFKLSDRQHYPTLLGDIEILVHEYSQGKFSLQLYDPLISTFPNSPFRIPPYLFLATIMRGSNCETGGVFELDVVLPVPDTLPDSAKHGWRSVLWSGLVWVLSIGLTAALASTFGYWLHQWRRQDGYEPL